jgi:ABC-type antimicrobial peptide transport system permease subunit
MLMSTYERAHEIGMLLALGATPWRVRRMIVTEAIVLGLTGALIGTVLGGAFVLVAGHTGIDFAKLGGETADTFAMEGMRLPLVVRPWLKPTDVVIGFCAAVVMSAGAALWPAFVASRLEPMEALRD